MSNGLILGIVVGWMIRCSQLLLNLKGISECDRFRAAETKVLNAQLGLRLECLKI